MRITTPFTATSTARDVLAGINLTDRSIIVTGVSSGIGVETARSPPPEPTSPSPSATRPPDDAPPTTSPPPRATTASTSADST